MWLVYRNPARSRALIRVRKVKEPKGWDGPPLLATSIESALALVPSGAPVSIWVRGNS